MANSTCNSNPQAGTTATSPPSNAASVTAPRAGVGVPRGVTIAASQSGYFAMGNQIVGTDRMKNLNLVRSVIRKGSFNVETEDVSLTRGCAIFPMIVGITVVC